jgi:WD40 repeat protein
MRRVVWVGVVALFAAGSAAAQDKPTVRAKLEGHRGGVTAVAFSRDGKLVATGSGSGVVFLWDAKTGEQLARLSETGGNTITAVAISPDGTQLVASARGTVPNWNITDPKAPKPLRNLVTHAEARYIGVGVTGDGSAIVHAHAWRNQVASKVEFLPLTGAASARTLTGPDFFDARALACAPDADSQATAVYGQFGQKDTPAVFLFGLGDVKTVTRGVPLLAKDGPNQIAYSPDGKWLGVCSGSLIAWKVPGSQIVGGEPVIVAAEAHAAALGPRDLAATVAPPVEGAKVEVMLWRLGDDVKKLATHKTDLADVRCLAFSADGTTLAVGGYTDGVVQLWDMGEGKK